MEFRQGRQIRSRRRLAARAAGRRSDMRLQVPQGTTDWHNLLSSPTGLEENRRASLPVAHAVGCAYAVPLRD